MMGLNGLAKPYIVYSKSHVFQLSDRLKLVKKSMLSIAQLLGNVMYNGLSSGHGALRIGARAYTHGSVDPSEITAGFYIVPPRGTIVTGKRDII